MITSAIQHSTITLRTNTTTTPHSTVLLPRYVLMTTAIHNALMLTAESESHSGTFLAHFALHLEGLNIKM